MTNLDQNYPIPAPTHDEPEDMGAVRSIFDRAANAIVEASRLSKEVAALRSEFDTLKWDMEYLRARNRELDEMLAQTRAQRDEALSQVHAFRNELVEAKSHNDSLTAAQASNEHSIASLEAELGQTRKDRDAYGMEAMQAKDELAKAKATIDKLRSVIQATAGQVAELLREPDPVITHAEQVHNPADYPDQPNVAYYNR